MQRKSNRITSAGIKKIIHDSPFTIHESLFSQS